MERRETLSPAEQRTWDMQIVCTCCAPVQCLRFHGLPLLTGEFLAQLTDVAAHDRERDKLYALYNSLYNDPKRGDERKTAFSRLTAPFNDYY